jgi:hypothetical protein
LQNYSPALLLFAVVGVVVPVDAVVAANARFVVES